MNNEDKKIIDKWLNIRMGKLWILILLLLFWPAAIIYFFLSKWPNQLTIDELNEYKRYLQLRKVGNND